MLAFLMSTAAKKDLLAIGGDAETVDRVLNRWIEARLLTGTRDSSGGLVLVDVAHEALIRKWPRIREWMEEGREAARLTGILRQAVSEWIKKNRAPGFLFQGAYGKIENHQTDANNNCCNRIESYCRYIFIL